jgi:antagonist of SinR
MKVAITDSMMMNGMDAEWLALIVEAKALGISKETILDFLHQNEVHEILVKNF